MKQENSKQFNPLLSSSSKRLWFGPTIVFSIFFILHLVTNSDLFLNISLSDNYSIIYARLIEFEPYLFWFMLASCSYWLFSRILAKFLSYLGNTSIAISHPLWSLVLPFLGFVLRILFFLVLLTNLTQRFQSPQAYFLDRVLSVLIIVSIAWIFVKLIEVVSQILINQYNGKDAQPNRKVYTQILLIKRIVLSIVFILAIGSILMLFENVRALGASVLTTAGIAGLIITFTAQRSLSSLFSSLEIALTQPIKIGDAIVIENKFGTVEEINFRNVVIKLWDWRRLIIPTNYFLEKPFENWSRDVNNHLIGVVTLSVDFTLPISKVRNELHKLLEASEFWDKKVGSLEVSDLKERVMELKILASASNPSDVANLQANLREQLINFIARVYPECLPMTRSFSVKNTVIE